MHTRRWGKGLLTIVLVLAAVLLARRIGRVALPQVRRAVPPGAVGPLSSAAPRMVRPHVAPDRATARAPAAPTAAPAAPPARALPPDPYAAAELLATRTSAPDASGRVRRVRLVRTAGQYPLLRVEESLRRDVSVGNWVVIDRLAMVADHLLVQLAERATETDLARLNAAYGGRIRKRLRRPGLFLVSFAEPGLDTVPQQRAAYGRHAATARVAEPDYLLYPADTVPNDPRYGDLWGMAKIDAPAAWDVTTGSAEVVVGVIDTGVDYTHEDIAGNMWTNPNEIAGNGLDDDRNGYEDDVYGWDFGDQDSDPRDDDGHGTHVAGTVAAMGNNATGVVGVSWNTKIMAIKFFDRLGAGHTSAAIEAVTYATTMYTNGVNIRITNNSWGGGGFSQLLQEAIRDAGTAGQVFVAAAGNFGVNNDNQPFYPSSYDADNIVAVAWSTQSDSLSSSSHYGATTVDLAAPGSSILSLARNGGYRTSNGTSMASPHVAGALALLLDVHPGASVEQMRTALFEGVDHLPALEGRCVSEGRLNAAGMLAAVPPVIEHTPLVNTTNATTPYRVEAVIHPARLLDTNALDLLWNVDGSTNAFRTNRLIHAAGDRYVTEIPPQPRPTEIQYYLRAATAAGRDATHPAGAPAELHRFASVGPVELWVTAFPSEIGTVTPPYGNHVLASGTWVQASADLHVGQTNGQRHTCVGWAAVGDAPVLGATNEVSFVIENDSLLAWNWEYQFRLQQTSSPTGLVATESWWSAFGPAATIKAPATRTLGSSVVHFVEWQFDGVRQPDATNPARNPVTAFLMPTARTAVAHYLSGDTDADGDDLPDWWERFYFGSLDPTLHGDPDGDGFDNAAEYGDRTHPRDPASQPMPPVIAHTALADPQTRPAPWTISAVVTDNFEVVEVYLNWRRAPGGWALTRMVPGDDPHAYRQEIPAPGVAGDDFEYSIQAADRGSSAATTTVHAFHVTYPAATVTPGSLVVLLPPGGMTNVSILVTNSGTADLDWSLEGGWREDVEWGVGGVTHAGAGDLWHISTNRARSGSHAWYCGQSGSTWEYIDSMDASLVLPPLALGTNALLQFYHWPKMEYDTDQMDDHYWDGGVVELSTNGGVSYAPIQPEGGYPHRITSNPASPFDPETPCFGGNGGWRQDTFDLAAYAGESVRLRFRFGSDGFVVEEGWTIDDIQVIQGQATSVWLTAGPPAGRLVPAGTQALDVVLDGSGLATATRQGVLQLRSNDPFVPTNDLPVTLLVRSPPRLALLDAAQTSTDGSGHVTLSNRLSDADGEACEIVCETSVDHGASWTGVWLVAAEAGVGVPAVADGQVRAVATADGGVPVTNDVALTWATREGPAPLLLAPAAVVRARAWDGLLWSPAVTSSPFLVDNETPAGLPDVWVAGHTADTWSTNNILDVCWFPGSDGSGVGLAGYGVAQRATPTGDVPAVVRTASTQVLETVAMDGTWHVGVRALDRFGNAGPTTYSGAYGIDTTPPGAASATVTVALSQGGPYVVGTVVTGAWSGFTDPHSGVVAYYYALQDGGGTTNGRQTAQTSGVLTGAVLEATNRVYVWAQDDVGLVGTAAVAEVLVLDPTQDFDGDTLRTADEEIAGTDAADPASVLRVASIRRRPGGTGTHVVVGWQSVTGRQYHLYTRLRLTNSAAAWGPAAVFSNAAGAGGPMSYTDDVGTAEMRFYRLGVTKP